MLEARLGETFTGLRLARAQALIDDASALVRQRARGTIPTPVPAEVVAVVVQVVRRALEDTWQQFPPETDRRGQVAQHPGSNLYLTRAEVRILRAAVGRSTFASLTMGDPA